MTWYLHNNDVLRQTEECPGHGVYCNPRPVVVIDAEDRGQVEQLEAAMARRCGWHYLPDEATKRGNALQAALREFANPTPPKPDEPKGIGAVVEDDQHVIWVLTPDEKGGLLWQSSHSTSKWSGVDAVRVLSEGVFA